MLKTSICANSVEDIELYKKKLEIIKNAGFDAVDLGFFTEAARQVLRRDDAGKYAQIVRQATEDAGLFIGQAHAPYNPRIFKNPEAGKKVLEDTYRAIEFCAEMGAPYIVCHPIRCHNAEDPLYYKHDELHRLNVEMYSDLVKMASGTGLTICTENIFTYDSNEKIVDGYTSYPEEMIRIMEAVPGLAICFDAGHAALIGQDYGKYVRAFGSRLKALHVHGNNGLTDLHNGMFEDRITNWDGFTAALSDIGYTGTMNAEIKKFGIIPDELIQAYYDYIGKCTRYLAAKVN